MEKVMTLKEFFKRPVPDFFKELENQDFNGYDYGEIIKQIAFHKPFLKTEKIAIFKGEENGIKNYRSVGQGTIFPKDTDGHYNSTIYLAECGRLMASTASIHLAYMFKEYAPQVAKANEVAPLKGLKKEDQILKPAVRGSTFWIDTQVLKVRAPFVFTKTVVVFGNTPYGTIDDLKFVLTHKESIYSAKEIMEKE